MALCCSHYFPCFLLLPFVSVVTSSLHYLNLTSLDKQELLLRGSSDSVAQHLKQYFPLQPHTDTSTQRSSAAAADQQTATMDGNDLHRALHRSNNNYYNSNYNNKYLLNSTSEFQDIRQLQKVTQHLPKPQQSDLDSAKLKYGPLVSKKYLSIAKPKTFLLKRLRRFQAESELAPELDGSRETKVRRYPHTFQRGVLKKKKRKKPRLPKTIRSMNFYLKKRMKKPKKMGTKVSKLFRQWLWELSKCRVVYHWSDLGVNVFPRYVLQGSCSNKQTCSFPAGMTCIEAERTPVNVHLFTCVSGDESACKWMSLTIDVLKKCKCRCHKK